jgi:hypothetical protein
MGKVHSHSVDEEKKGESVTSESMCAAEEIRWYCRKVCLGEFDDLQCSANPEIVTCLEKRRCRWNCKLYVSPLVLYIRIQNLWGLDQIRCKSAT